MSKRSNKWTNALWPATRYQPNGRVDIWSKRDAPHRIATMNCSISRHGASPLELDLFNLTDVNRVDLDLDAMSGSGGILRIAARRQQHFMPSIVTSRGSLFRAEYVLNLPMPTSGSEAHSAASS